MNITCFCFSFRNYIRFKKRFHFHFIFGIINKKRSDVMREFYSHFIHITEYKMAQILPTFKIIDQ